MARYTVLHLGFQSTSIKGTSSCALPLGCKCLPELQLRATHTFQGHHEGELLSDNSDGTVAEWIPGLSVRIVGGVGDRMCVEGEARGSSMPAMKPFL